MHATISCLIPETKSAYIHQKERSCQVPASLLITRYEAPLTYQERVTISQRHSLGHPLKQLSQYSKKHTSCPHTK